VAGARLTEADWRSSRRWCASTRSITATSNANLRRIVDYPNLSNYLRDLYQVRASPRPWSLDHIKRHYYGSQRKVNPTGIVPLGPSSILASRMIGIGL